MVDLEQDVRDMFEELRCLRLSHKLKKYFLLERRIASLKQSAQALTLDNGQRQVIDTQLDELSRMLNACVMCGMNECFICSDKSGHNLVPFKRSTSSSVHNHSPTRSTSSISYGSTTSYDFPASDLITPLSFGSVEQNFNKSNIEHDSLDSTKNSCSSSFGNPSESSSEEPFKQQTLNLNNNRLNTSKL